MKNYFRVPVYIFKESETKMSNVIVPNKTANIITNVIAKK